ncbi:MAG: hypothetical protein GEU83_21130 [Pseudonocardiaceae bacterium]|nr:hypothetical protein [Pseudonocardiaceae bacterium]
MTPPPVAPPISPVIATAGGWGWAQTVALIVPIIAALGGVMIWSLTQRAGRRERRSKAFAAALASVEAYVEMPYRIRRRPDDVGARHELTGQISTLQADIAWHQAWIELEAPAVTDFYRTLIRVTRAQAGAQMHEAWLLDPIRHDSEMNLGIAYPREQIDAARADCLTAMSKALRLLRSY